MYNIAKLSNNDRDIVFTKYAFENGVSNVSSGIISFIRGII